MGNKLARNTAIYTLGNILPPITQFIMLPIYLKHMTTEDFGITSSLNTLTTILTILFSVSLSRSIYRLYYDYSGEERKEFIGSIGISILGTSSIGLIIVLIINNLISKIFESIPFFPYYLYAILAAYFSLFENVPKVALVVKEKAGTYFTISLLQIISANAFIYYFVVIHELGAQGYLKGYLFGVIFPLPIFIKLFLKSSVWVFRMKYFRNAIKFSLPTVPNQIIVWIVSLSNRIFLERFFSLTEVAIYALGFRITSVILILATSFKKAYDPYFYRIANSSANNKKENLEISNNLYLSIILLIAFIVAFFSRELILLFFSIEYYDAIYIIPVLAIGVLFDRMQGITNLSFYQYKKTHIVMYISFISAVVSIFFNFILIPKYSIYGAALAALVTYIIAFFVKYNLSKRHFFIKMYVFKHLSTMFSFFIIIITVNEAIDYFNVIVEYALAIKILITIFVMYLWLRLYADFIPVEFRKKYRTIFR